MGHQVDLQKRINTYQIHEKNFSHPSCHQREDNFMR